MGLNCWVSFICYLMDVFFLFLPMVNSSLPSPWRLVSTSYRVVVISHCWIPSSHAMRIFFPFFPVTFLGVAKHLKRHCVQIDDEEPLVDLSVFLVFPRGLNAWWMSFFFTCGWKFNVFFFTKRGDIWRIKSTRHNIILVVPWLILVVVASASLSIFICMAWWEIKFFMRMWTHIKVIWCECLCMWSSLDLNWRDDKVV